MELLLIFTFIENKFTAVSVSCMGLLEKANQDSFFSPKFKRFYLSPALKGCFTATFLTMSARMLH